jgi:hypothetical protein
MQDLIVIEAERREARSLVLSRALPGARIARFSGSLQANRHRLRALHQYADGEKLDAYGWRKGNVPTTFRDKPDDEIS